MKKLSDLTKKEHYFYTIDGTILKTTHDLFAYLDSCDISNYEYHVNDKKNDFAEWIRTTLLFPELATAFNETKSISDSKKALIEFFSAYENQPSSIKIEDFFHTTDDYILKTTHELYYYLNNCDDANYYAHVTAQRNDFAAWARNMLNYPQLSEELLQAKNREQAASSVRDFVLYSPFYRGGAQAYTDYIHKLREEKIGQKRSDDPKIKALEEFIVFKDEEKSEEEPSGLKTFMPAVEEKKVESIKVDIKPEKGEDTISLANIKVPQRPDDEVREAPKPVSLKKMP